MKIHAHWIAGLAIGLWAAGCGSSGTKTQGTTRGSTSSGTTGWSGGSTGGAGSSTTTTSSASSTGSTGTTEASSSSTTSTSSSSTGSTDSTTGGTGSTGSASSTTGSASTTTTTATSTTGTTGTTGGTTGSTTGSTTGTTTGGTTGSAPTNDTCANPYPIQLGVAVQSDTTNAHNDYTTSQSGSCESTINGNPAPDLVYSFTAPAGSTSNSYVVTVTPSTSWDVVLDVMSSCPAAPSVLSACTASADNGGNGAAETATINNLLPGQTAYIVVDGYHSIGSAGPFTITVNRPAAGPSNDLCANALPLQLNTPVTGDTTNASNDYDPPASATACASAPGHDVVYYFTVAQTAGYTFTLTPTSGYWAVLNLISQCPSVGSQPTSCIDSQDFGGPGQPEAVTDTLTAGQVVYVIVDGERAADNGTFTLGVTSP